MLMTAGRRQHLHGQSLVEVAISLPVLLLLALGVTDIGRAFYYREAVTNSARQALRIAVSPAQHATADAVCAGAGGPSAVTVTTSLGSSGGSIASIVNLASLESSSNGTAAGSVISGGTISVTFHCLAGAVITNATSNGAGPLDPGSDAVTVSVTYRLNVITPLLWPLTGTSFPITVTSYERAEY
ncbi:MAG TPA: TadE/TadG family type IV pilus assembly protein [Candidatus Micrarchaeaceae archaeon]|nr:TadE/TadG family type IV pilus assembly protein [Candidatus Micrarchaeaceae archaeon]